MSDVVRVQAFIHSVDDYEGLQRGPPKVLHSRPSGQHHGGH